MRKLSIFLGTEVPDCGGIGILVNALNLGWQRGHFYQRKCRWCDRYEVPKALENAEKTLGERYPPHFAKPNFYFHGTATHAILRQYGTSRLAWARRCV